MSEERGDPRIQRTKDHVLAAAVDLLNRAEEPLNFATLAAAAQVSRKTLYNHWGSIEALIIDTFDHYVVEALDLNDHKSFDQRVDRVMTMLSEYLVDKGAATSVAMIMAAANHNPECRTYLDHSRRQLLALLTAYLGPMDLNTYSLIFGSTLYVALSTGEISVAHRRSVGDVIRERVTANPRDT
jgi:AcrR family transcriptional regulator